MILRTLANWLKGERSPRRAVPALEALEDRWLPSGVTYHGGPLIANVAVEALYYGTDWSNKQSPLSGMKDHLDKYLGSLVKSAYMDQLREYSEPGYTIGHGQFLGSQVIDATLTPGTTVNDADVQKAINDLIPHDRFGRPDANRLYVVFTPPNVHVQDGNANSYNSVDSHGHPNEFRGYHSNLSGSSIPYAVLVDQKGNYAPNALVYPEQEQFTWVASHELAEAVTDPAVGRGWFGANTSQEIGDLALADLGVLTLDGVSYAVQKEWSNFQAQATGNGALLLHASNTVAFTLDGAGNLYEVTTDCTLRHRNAAGAWNVLDPGAQTFALGPGAVLYELKTNGDLTRFNTATGTWLSPLDHDVKAFTFGPGYVLYDLRANGDLTRFNASTGSWLSGLDSNVQTFTLRSDRVLYEQKSNGDLARFDTATGKWLTALDHNVRAYTFGPNNVLYDLRSNGDLVRFDTAAGAWLGALDHDVQTFTIWLDNVLYDLKSNGDLARFDTTTGAALPVLDHHVKAYAFGAGNVLYDLRSNGDLANFDTTTGAAPTVLDHDVLTFSLGLDRVLYDLRSTGDLARFDTTTGTWLSLLDSHVVEFALGAGGYTVDVLESQGNLRQYHGSTQTLLGSNVRSFWFEIGGHTLDALEANDTVRRFPA